MRLGCVLGKRFLLLKHTGRRSGLQRETVLEVMRYDESDNRYIVCSGWGEASEWYKNLQRTPQAEIVVGNRPMKITAVRLSPTEAAQEMRRYARSHPVAYRVMRTILGEASRERTDDFGALASRLPLMSFEVRNEDGSLTKPRLIRAGGAHVRRPKQTRFGYLRNWLET
jgi:deazaflavin-dependent oxidoreductase (nitroreductase family)